MAVYGAGSSHAGVNTADTAYFAVRATATTTRVKIIQIVVEIVAAPTNAPTFYLVRTTAAGTVTTTLAGFQLDPAEAAAIGTFDSVWSVAPTFTAANKISVGGMGGAAGNAFVWTFPDDSPLIITATTGNGIGIVNATAAGATVGTFAASALWRE